MTAPTSPCGCVGPVSWADLPVDCPMDLLSRRRVIGRQAMISHVTLEEGCHVPMHAHANEQITCVIEGKLRMRLGGASAGRPEELIVQAGQVLLIPCDVPHEALALERTVVLDVFSPPSSATGIDRTASGG